MATQQAAKKTAPAKKTTPPPLDLLKLTISDAPAPQRQVGVSTEDIQFLLVPMRDSWSKKVEMTPARGGLPATYKGSGKRIERVPNESVTMLSNLIRRAATVVGRENGVSLGAAIQVVELNGADKGYSHILFAAKTARKGGPRKSTSTTA